MRLMTRSELAGRKENELSALFQSVSRNLARTRRGTPERRNGLATMENITRARIDLICAR
jgi:hypothetical protein